MAIREFGTGRRFLRRSGKRNHPQRQLTYYVPRTSYGDRWASLSNARLAAPQGRRGALEGRPRRSRYGVPGTAYVSRRSGNPEERNPRPPVATRLAAGWKPFVDPVLDPEQLRER